MRSVFSGKRKIGDESEMYICDKDDEKQPVYVKSRIAFSRMGCINTLNEKFDCQAFVECIWQDDELFKKLIKDVKINESNERKIQEKLSAFKFNPNENWTPKIFFDNALGEVKSETVYKLRLTEKIDDNNQETMTISVIEQRFIKGSFHEILELNDFPMDTQELSITLTSQFPDTEVKFIANSNEPSTISSEVFLDQQEWTLFGFVETKEKTIYDHFKGFNRSGFSCSAMVARKPRYYFNNAYFVIFIITALGFVPFSVVPSAPQSRMSVGGILILTQVNFRWIITQRIPPVSYLTSIDKYAIGNLFFLIIFACWHAIIGSTLFESNGDMRVTIDTYVLGGFGVAFFIYTLFFIVKISLIIRGINEKGKKE